MISKDKIEQGMNFEEYYRFLEGLVDRNQTTGKEQDEKLVEYTKLNFFRTKRMLKNTCIPEQKSTLVKSIDQDIYWVLLTEPWCGDAANTVPIIALLATLNIRIDLKIFLRDEHPELMNHYLTGGARAIPKLVCYDKNLVELGNWGPRPKILQTYINELKETNVPSSDELKRQIQIWYNKDTGKSFLNEFDSTLRQWHTHHKVG